MAKYPFATLTEKGLNGTFLLSYTQQQPSFLTALTREVSSNQRKERYAGLGTQPKAERWAGEQHYGTMAETELEVTNNKWSDGIIIPGDEWRDDKTGQQAQRVRDLASEMRDQQSTIVLDCLLENTTLGYDGQPIFSASHRAVPGDETGVQTNIYNAAANGVTATGFATTIYGAVNRLKRMQDDRKRFMNRHAKTFVFVVHPNHTQAVQAALGDQLSTAGMTNTLARQSAFTVIPYFEPMIVDPSDGVTPLDDAFMFAIDRPSAMPFILQSKRGPVQHVLGPDSEWMKEHDSAKFGTNWEGGVAPWSWSSALKCDLT